MGAYAWKPDSWKSGALLTDSWGGGSVASHNGDLASTLGAATLSAAGVLVDTAALAVTLGAATLAAAGTQFMETAIAGGSNALRFVPSGGLGGRTVRGDTAHGLRRGRRVA